ncbi:hypothetical protein O181_056049 [Austropuccinia psidii MF-1]|uniref:Uncharacterized protein n=1 Tax=Austropuccinia psidii MF-1 TaxID=1389203 RepID=A0A9Q3E7U8_9BASI|nr:hypothetical protein [Austropuccinia psidii MF-1]
MTKEPFKGPAELEEITPSNQMGLDQDIKVKNPKDQNVSSEDRHKWRMLQLPPVPKVQKLAYGGKEAGVETSLKYLDRSNELLSLSEEVHGPRKDRRTSEGLGTHVLQGRSPTDKSLVEKPKHVIRGPEEEVGPRKGQQPSGSSPSLQKQKSSSTSAKKGQENPKEQSEGQAKGKGKGKIQVEQALPTELQNSQEGEDSHEQCVQYGKNPHGIQKQGRGKIEPIFLKEVDLVKDRPMSWFLKQKDWLTALHHDMSETKINKRILTKCGGDLEHAIRSRCIEPCSTEDYINAMEDITTRNKNLKELPRINKIEIDKAEDTKETNNVSLHESDSEHSEEEGIPDELSIENINFFFELTEVHTHLPQYSYECMDVMHVQEAKMQKSKPSRGQGYTDGASCITNIVINNREAKLHLDSGAFCTCVGKDYLYSIYTNWKESLMPIEGIKFSSASPDMHPLGIFESAMIFPHPAGSIRLKV